MDAADQLCVSDVLRRLPTQLAIVLASAVAKQRRRGLKKTLSIYRTFFRETDCSHFHAATSHAWPHAVHSPASVPHHFFDEVLKQLQEDVRRGIVEPVPAGEPTE
ncbi:hypothetical protein GWK47_032624 [Chionoecetes opilio]|uniref:Uncharacterized protein n=1 Tax=Chionoecetes opilio TaxID=41210 RepID=A0A8J4YHT1_CHIOP|nr:hypothetical protein GWK47_032624 [Chionoecetes opilio]